MIILDTHIWLWWLLGDGNISDKERDQFDKLATKGLLSISWVTIWETEMLERKGRIRLEPNFSEWIKKATHPDFLVVLPIDIDVVLTQRKLPDTFHNDPADRLLVSTSILSGYQLATKDSLIIESKVCEIWSL